VTAVVVLSPLLLLFRRRFFLFLVGWFQTQPSRATTRNVSEFFLAYTKDDRYHYFLTLNILYYLNRNTMSPTMVFSVRLLIRFTFDFFFEVGSHNPANRPS